MTTKLTMPLSRQQQRTARRAPLNPRQALPRTEAGVRSGVRLSLTIARATLAPSISGTADLQPGNSEYALCAAHQIENATAAIHKVRRRLNRDYDSKQCDVALREGLQHWGTSNPIAILTPQQLAISLAAECIAFSLASIQLPTGALQTIFNNGEYLVVIDTFGEEKLSTTVSLDLATANLFAPFTVQQLAGGHLSAWPARVHAAFYFVGYGHDISQEVTAALLKKQLKVYQRVCALLCLYQDSIIDFASTLLSNTLQSSSSTDRSNFNSEQCEIQNGARFIRYHADLIASLQDLPFIPPAGGGTIQ